MVAIITRQASCHHMNTRNTKEDSKRRQIEAQGDIGYCFMTGGRAEHSTFRGTKGKCPDDEGDELSETSQHIPQIVRMVLILP